MASLRDKIQENAERRLQLPEGRRPSQELGRYKDFLRHESNRLKHLHRSGADGGEVCRARAWVVDLLLQHLVRSVMTDLPPLPAGESPRFALVAIGGYGRGELNPQSDIDLMFLHTLDSGVLARGKVHPWLTALTDGLLYTLWDVGMKVGHSVRSVEDCVRVANTDMQSKTSLLEARWIAGDVELFRRMEAVFLARSVRGQVEAYLAARIADQEARRQKYGGSATMQEPNIKNGCGGLRDYQNLLWMAFFKYRTRTIADLEERELVSGEERAELVAAYDYLLRVRNELHYETNRPADALPRALQPRVAHNLGYTHRSPVRRLEEFMRDLYLHMRNIYLITRTLEQRLALLPDPLRRLPSLRQLLHRGRRRIGRQVIDGFEFAAGQVTAQSRRVFRDQPRRLLRVFLHAQQRGMRLHPDLAQLIRQQLGLVTAEFRRDPHASETFLEILSQRGNVAPTLRAMHETGLLGRYLPEFEPLTCLVQHEFYHHYAADEHTLQCLEHLDRIWEASAAPYQGYSEVFGEVERPSTLYLSLLLHDAGKAHHEPDHAATGAHLALGVARRLGLDGATTHSLCLVIEHHLLMTQISQRRDLDDPSVIRVFASQVQTTDNLRMLTLHTLADSLGTSDRLWNGFKDALLLQLYRKCQEHITGAPVFREAEVRRRALLADQVGREVGRELEPEEIQAHFDSLPARYFNLYEVDDIVSDLRLVNQFLKRQRDGDETEALSPVLCWDNQPDRGCTLLRVCTWDRPGSFAKLTGSLTAAGLNILGAQIFSRLDSILIDSFSVIEARTGQLVDREEREKCERLLTRVLTRGDVELADQIGRRPLPGSLYYSVEGERIATRATFDNETSDYYTVLDLETEDSVGLLYAVTRELAELGLDIVLARVSTEKGAAVDSFYLAELDGSKVTGAERQQHIAQRLVQRIEELRGLTAR